jgi:hypothetical protein
MPRPISSDRKDEEEENESFGGTRALAGIGPCAA